MGRGAESGGKKGNEGNERNGERIGRKKEGRRDGGTRRKEAGGGKTQRQRCVRRRGKDGRLGGREERFAKRPGGGIRTQGRDTQGDGEGGMDKGSM